MKPPIRGRLVALRPSHEGRRVYEWMAASEVTRWMMGPPLFPEAPIPTWEEFCADYVPLFFDGTQPDFGRSYIVEVDGEAVGHVNYSEVDRTRGKAELDIWLNSEAVCGRGYGSDALVALTEHLRETLSLTQFIVRPSRRNERAMKAYAKAGFVLLPLSTQEQAAIYGPTEHYDTVVMSKRMPVETAAAAMTSTDAD
jgi:RimJ/RimL family protein N-acetyltransferase